MTEAKPHDSPMPFLPKVRLRPRSVVSTAAAATLNFSGSASFAGVGRLRPTKTETPKPHDHVTAEALVPGDTVQEWSDRTTPGPHCRLRHRRYKNEVRWTDGSQGMLRRWAVFHKVEDGAEAEMRPSADVPLVGLAQPSRADQDDGQVAWVQMIATRLWQRGRSVA